MTNQVQNRKDASRTVASPMATIELCLRRLFGRLRAGALLGAVRSPMARLRSIDTISKWSRALLSSAPAPRQHNRKPRSHNEACRSIRGGGGDDVSRLRSAAGTTQHGGPVMPPKHAGREIHLGNVFAMLNHPREKSHPCGFLYRRMISHRARCRLLPRLCMNCPARM